MKAEKFVFKNLVLTLHNKKECSLHIAKYRNEQKVARFHIVTYII